MKRQGCYLPPAVLILASALWSPGLFAQTSTTVTEAQTIARLYSASLDRPPFTNGLNFFINSFESGRTVISIAEDFVLSDEFVAKYDELDDVAYVERLFLNVLGRPGAQGGIDYWVPILLMAAAGPSYRRDLPTPGRTSTKQLSSPLSNCTEFFPVFCTDG